MATLATTTRNLRELLKVGGIGLIILLVIVWIFRLAFYIKDTYFPSPEVPNYNLGVLPKLPFKTPTDQKITYKINTISGELSVFPKLISVYRLQTHETDLLTLRYVRERLRRVGFTNNETKVDEVLYQWHDFNVPDRVITYNILNGNFDISSNYVTNPQNLGVGILEPPTEIIGVVTRFLETMGENIEDIDIQNSEITFLKINNFTLVPAHSLQEAQVVRVTLKQKNINELPVMYKNNNSSDMRFYLGKQGQGLEIIGAFFKHRVVNLNESGTYPILTAQQAFEELQKGNALLTDYNGSQNINITNVYLAYYMGDETDEYALPIIVFEGINFRAYVPAIQYDN